MSGERRDKSNADPLASEMAPGPSSLGCRHPEMIAPPSDVEWLSLPSIHTSLVYPERTGNSSSSDEEMDLTLGEVDLLSQISSVSLVSSTNEELSDDELEPSEDQTNDPSADPSSAQEACFSRCPGTEVSGARR